MELFEDLIGKYEKKITKAKLESGKVREGRTWKQIAAGFSRDALEILKDNPEGIAVSGKMLREIVGNPNNDNFRRTCRDNGIRLIKSRGKDIYRIEKHDIVKEKLKKYENSGMF